MGFLKRRGISTQTHGELYRVGDGNSRVTVIAVSRGTTKDWPLVDGSQEEARRGVTPWLMSLPTSNLQKNGLINSVT